MKKSVKSIGIAVITVILIVLGLLVWSILGFREHIHTEYGDSFTVIYPLWDDEISIKDDNSHYFKLLSDFDGKISLKPTCDSPFFRCYQIKESKENVYICKIKEQGGFFSIDLSYKEGIISDLTNFKEWYISNFLCDYHYMEIILPYLDELYHDEMIAVAQKLISRDFEGLDKYGLTEEMINDKESLEEKIGIMEKYLKENGGEHSESSDQ